MRTIDEIAKNFIAAYNLGDKNELLRQYELLLSKVNSNEWEFRRIEHYYLVGKALYYLQEEDKANTLTDEEYGTIDKLIYYCLLKNYLRNKDVDPTNGKYGDLIGGCELGVYIICMEHEFLNFELIRAGFLPSYPPKCLRNQLLLFWGTVNEAKKINCFYSTNMFEEITNELEQQFNVQLPMGEDWQKFKIECLPILENVVVNLEHGFKYL
ncbi:hypothetical protein [Phocaeicola salanitronis]|uniref:hypothetical protein n=1 Tax=Phocaeicola salanitronis TaxID=376805 RepID=UPI0023F82C2F|nr:hypothetical protein [Phocaeicola salanitronis]